MMSVVRKGLAALSALVLAQVVALPASAQSEIEGSGPLPTFGGGGSYAGAVYTGLVFGIFNHEFGHALINELQLPSTGPEEDAVDIYSALQVAEFSGGGRGDAEVEEMSNLVALYPALQWYYSGRLSEDGGESSPWQDEHTADLKRFRNMYCILFGANPSVYGRLTDQFGFQERTLYRCAEEYARQKRAWRSILAPHTRAGPRHPEGQQPANARGAPVQVTFLPSSRRVGSFYRRYLSEVLSEMLVAQTSEVYVLPRPLSVVFTDCGQLNAFYDPEQGRITMCYELLEHLAVMISDIETNTVGGYERGMARESGDVAAGGGAIDPRLDAAFGQARLDEGFMPDPHRVRLTAGGPIAAATVASGCVGQVAAAPDYRIEYSAGAAPLIFRTRSGGDTTLLINDPQGRWICDDDSGGGVDAEIRLSRPASGVYDIWVGAYEADNPEADLLITEIP